MRASRVAREFRGVVERSSASYAASSSPRWRRRSSDGEDAREDATPESDDAFEAMMAMDDAYGSGVMSEEKSGRPRESAAEKAKRVAAELAKRGILVGDRVRVDVRVGAPLPARSKKFASDAGAASEAGATASTSTTDSTATKRRFITRAVHGYVVCVRNGRAGVKRTGRGDTETSFPTYPTAWCTALDVGELWEMCTGPRNLAGVSGASDEALAEYLKATGQSSDEEEEEEARS